MAVAAEQLNQPLQDTANFSLDLSMPHERIPNGNAVEIPEMSFVRKRAHQRATEILEKNRQYLIEGEFESAPVPVDAQGTARRLAEAKTQFGMCSPEYSEVEQGLELDCQRLYAEAFRKQSWEYFPEAKQRYDPTLGDYIAHGVSVTEILDRGLSPMAEPEERIRRINESVEEGTYRALGRMCLNGAIEEPKPMRVRTISECADWAIEAHQKDTKASYGGYVPSIEKFMIRSVRFDNNGDRYEEQLGMPGLHITHDVILAVLKDQGAIMPEVALTKIELHGKQFIENNDESVIGFAKLLDAKASCTSGQNIYMGEIVPDNFVKDYDQIPAEAKARQQELTFESKLLARFIVALEENGTDSWQAEGLVESHVQERMLKIAEANPQQAEIMFDSVTARGFNEVAHLQSLGLYTEAAQLRDEVRSSAPQAVYCGAGSCGLESVSELSSEATKARELGLSGGKLLHDKERACISCNKKSVYYDSKNKACTSCGLTQINKKIEKKNLKKPRQKPLAKVINLEEQRRLKARAHANEATSSATSSAVKKPQTTIAGSSAGV